MSEGIAWVDRVMRPLAGPLKTSDYNRVYEAVARGNEEQGKQLVRAILNVLEYE